MHAAHRHDVVGQQKMSKYADVIERLRGGETLAEIAEAHGVTAATIRNWRIKAYEEAQRELDISTEGYRMAQVARREELIEAYWDKAIQGDMEAARLVKDLLRELEDLLGLKAASEKDVVQQTVYVLNLPGGTPAQLQDGNTVEGEVEIVRE